MHSVDELSSAAIERVMSGAAVHDNALSQPTARDALAHKTLILLFYEPSTRTYASFYAAGLRLGMRVLPVPVHNSSVLKGESLEDTVRTLQEMGDVIVLRHPDIGSSLRAQRVCRVPVINAGDGAGEHPTQALLDLFTIRQLGSVKTVTFFGDLKHSRVVRSLSKLLAKQGFICLMVPAHADLGLPDAPAHEWREVDTFTDVLYVTRPQVERGKIAVKYQVTKKMLERCKPTLRIFHALPHTDEIHAELEEDPRAAWWLQVANGVQVRANVLCHVLQARSRL